MGHPPPKNVGPPPTRPPYRTPLREQIISEWRDQYVRGFITVEEFEEQVWLALTDASHGVPTNDFQVFDVPTWWQEASLPRDPGKRVMR